MFDSCIAVCLPLLLSLPLSVKSMNLSSNEYFLKRVYFRTHKNLVRIKEQKDDQKIKMKPQNFVRRVALFYMFRVIWILRPPAFSLLRDVL